MQYYEVPGEVLEDVDLLAPWIEDAVAVAARTKRRRSGR